MKKNEIILVLGTMVGSFIVCFSSNSTTILQLFGLIIGMAIVAGTAAIYGCRETKDHYKEDTDKEYNRGFDKCISYTKDWMYDIDESVDGMEVSKYIEDYEESVRKRNKFTIHFGIEDVCKRNK